MNAVAAPDTIIGIDTNSESSTNNADLISQLLENTHLIINMDKDANPEILIWLIDALRDQDWLTGITHSGIPSDLSNNQCLQHTYSYSGSDLENNPFADALKFVHSNSERRGLEYAYQQEIPITAAGIQRSRHFSSHPRQLFNDIYSSTEQLWLLRKKMEARIGSKGYQVLAEIFSHHPAPQGVQAEETSSEDESQESKFRELSYMMHAQSNIDEAAGFYSQTQGSLVIIPSFVSCQLTTGYRGTYCLFKP